ncbi:MAG: hypothetical protein PWP16_1488, partial [Eubacteriaceae bacterium]|nr:hypothetical protein [Eubacteriaceae bacterium]
EITEEDEAQLEDTYQIKSADEDEDDDIFFE